MKQKISQVQIASYGLLLFVSIAFYFHPEILMAAFFESSRYRAFTPFSRLEDFIGVAAVLGVAPSLCLDLARLDLARKRVPILEIPTPWLMILALTSSISSIKNLFSLITAHLTYKFFFSEEMFLLFSVVAPAYIAFTTLKTLKEKLTNYAR